MKAIERFTWFGSAVVMVNVAQTKGPHATVAVRI
jgi:hypothetical protein